MLIEKSGEIEIFNWYLNANHCKNKKGKTCISGFGQLLSISTQTLMSHLFLDCALCDLVTYLPIQPRAGKIQKCVHADF